MNKPESIPPPETSSTKQSDTDIQTETKLTFYRVDSTI